MKKNTSAVDQDYHVGRLTVFSTPLFLMTISCCFPGILVIKSQSCHKLHQNIVVLGCQFFWKGGKPFHGWCCISKR